MSPVGVAGSSSMIMKIAPPITAMAKMALRIIDFDMRSSSLRSGLYKQPMGGRGL